VETSVRVKLTKEEVNEWLSTGRCPGCGLQLGAYDIDCSVCCIRRCGGELEGIRIRRRGKTSDEL